jgi:PAT family beta-lactamase induction signal transducer AmpG
MASLSQSFLAYFQKKNLQIILLGCLSGIPLGLLIDPLNYWLAEVGVEKSTIGLFSLILIIYTIKALWAPLIDRLSLPILSGFGQRKSWLIFSQIVTGCFVISLGLIEPNSNILFFAYVAIFISIFSATQDICVDALRIELVQKKRARRSIISLCDRLSDWSSLNFSGCRSVSC